MLLGNEKNWINIKHIPIAVILYSGIFNNYDIMETDIKNKSW